MADRDPRVDPKRGDRTKAPDGFVYRIKSAPNGMVYWVSVDDDYEDCATLEEWREWAKDDEVLKVAK